MIYTEDILKEDDARALQIMEEAWNESEQHYSQQFLDMERWLKLYHLKVILTGITQRDIGHAEPRADEIAHLFYPVSRAVCDTIVAGIRGTIMPDEYDWLEAEALSSDMGREELAIIRAFMNNHLEKIKFAKNIERIILQALVMRWSCGLVKREIRGGYRRMRQPGKLEALRIAKKYGDDKLVDYVQKLLNTSELEAGFEYDPYKRDLATLQFLDTRDTRPDWRYPDVEYAEFFSFGETLPWHVLLTGEFSKHNSDGKYYNVSWLREQIKKQGGSDTSSTDSERSQSTLENAPAEPGVLEDSLKVRHYLTHHAWLMADAEYRVILAKRRLDGMPIVKLTYEQASNHWDGASAMQLMEPLQREINYMINFRRDNLERAVGSVIAVNKDLLEPGQNQIELHDGVNVIEVYGAANEALKGIHFPDVTANWQQDVQFLLDGMHRMIGMDIGSQGLYYQKHKPTATETDRVREAMMTRLGRWERDIETDLTSPSIGMLYSLEDAFYDREEMLAIYGSDAIFYPVMSRELFEIVGGQVRFYTRGTLYWQTKREELVFVQQAFQLALSAPPLQQGVNYLEIFKDILVTGGIRDPERFFIDRKDRQYTIPPEEEHRIFANGRYFPPGDLDNDEMHLREHQQFQQAVEAGLISPLDFPVQNLPFLIKHIKVHEEKLAAQQTTNPMGLMNPTLSPGQQFLPQLTSGSTTANKENLQLQGVA